MRGAATTRRPQERQHALTSTVVGVRMPSLPFNPSKSSRRTELQEKLPDHVVNAWLGHSSKVAAAHYLQMIDDHWSRGATELASETKGKNGGPAGGPTGGPAGGPGTAGHEGTEADEANVSQEKELLLAGCVPACPNERHPERA